MEELVKEKIKELLIDKSNWKLTKFGEVAIQQKKSVDREITSLSKYVKGEHMGSEDLHLRAWGELTDEYLGPAFIRYFEKDDILYGSRRTYLRKVVIAPFEGITSNTTFVIKANEKKIDKRLLPFIMMTDDFTEHSVRNSKGSVNPYINWKDISEYEFLLPPKEQQAKLAELLWAMDEAIEKEKCLLNNLKTNLDSLIENEIHGVDIYGKTIRMIIEQLSKKTKVVSLNSLGVFLKGKGISKSEVIENGIPCVRYGELYTKHHRIIRKYYSFVDRATADQSFRLEKNDIMFAGSGETITEIGKSASFVDDVEVYAGSDTLIFRPKEMDGFYLGYLLNSQLVRKQLNKFGTGATVMHIYQSDIKKIKVPLINIENQKVIASKLEQYASNIKLIDLKIQSSQSLQKSLINQVF